MLISLFIDLFVSEATAPVVSGQTDMLSLSLFNLGKVLQILQFDHKIKQVAPYLQFYVLMVPVE